MVLTVIDFALIFDISSMLAQIIRSLCITPIEYSDITKILSHSPLQESITEINSQYNQKIEYTKVIQRLDYHLKYIKPKPSMIPLLEEISLNKTYEIVCFYNFPLDILERISKGIIISSRFDISFYICKQL